MSTPEPIVLRADFRTVALRTGVPFGVSMGVILGGVGAVAGGLALVWSGPCAIVGALLGFVACAVLVGGGSGAMFGALMAAMTDGLTNRPPPTDWAAGEDLLAWGPASRWVGWEAVGGRLFLTSRRLRFVPHGVSFQGQREVSWPLASLGPRATRKTWGIVDNQLVIGAPDGSLAFVVEGRDRWMELLDRATAPPPAPAPVAPTPVTPPSPWAPQPLVVMEPPPSGTSAGPTIAPPEE